jgi:hypothetical protein
VGSARVDLRRIDASSCFDLHTCEISWVDSAMLCVHRFTTQPMLSGLNVSSLMFSSTIRIVPDD